MTMAPGRKKRGFWLELIFISVLLFLLITSEAVLKHAQQDARISNMPLQRSLAGQTIALNALK